MTKSAKPSVTTSESQQSPGCSLIAGICFALLSLATVAAFINTLRSGTDSDRWPTAQGTVIRSELEYDGEAYGAGITYEYQVLGTFYRGTHVRVSDAHYGNGHDEAQEALRRYPIGADVLVYYDPANPRTAVLEPGVYGDEWGITLMAVIFGFIAWIAFDDWKTRRAVEPKH